MVWMDETIEQLHYTTLHHDIGLTQQSNGLWDYTWNNNDYDDAKGLDSLYTACVFALLTAYNEIGRHGIRLYEGFGNRSYSLLKDNKNNLTRHKLHSYFMTCLTNIRRVQDVEELIITENNTNGIYTYQVFFRVLSITNDIIEDTIDLTNTLNSKPTIIEGNITTTTENNNITCTLLNKKTKLPVPYQVIRLYINEELTDRQITDENGTITFTLPTNNMVSSYLIRLESEPTSEYTESSTTLTPPTSITFHLNINSDGELIYYYDEDTPHPTFTINNEGELLMDYDDDVIKFETIHIDNDGYLIMNT